MGSDIPQTAPRLRAAVEEIDRLLLQQLEDIERLDDAALHRIALLETARAAALRLLTKTCAQPSA